MSLIGWDLGKLSMDELNQLSRDPNVSLCWTCSKVEAICLGDPVLDPYTICIECGHVFHSAQDLVDGYNEGIDPAYAKSEAEALSVFFCPLCLHDF